MPKPPRQERLAQLAAQLLHAAKAQDWSALQAADQELADQLPQLAALGAWSEPERAALHNLAQAHAAARQAVAAASAEQSAQMAQLQSGHEGWLAYAMNDATAP